jgi:uncharacterized phage-associated protein
VLYKRLRQFGNGRVTGHLVTEESVPPESYAAHLIEKVWRRYQKMSAASLSKLTHLPEAPWDVVWNQRGDKFGKIEPELIQSYYSERLNNA